MLRHRLRTFTLWTGTLLSLLIVVLFVVSAWWAIYSSIPAGSYVLVISGLLAFDSAREVDADLESACRSERRQVSVRLSPRVASRVTCYPRRSYPA